MNMIQSQASTQYRQRYNFPQNNAVIKPLNELLSSLKPATKAQLYPSLQLVNFNSERTVYEPLSPLDFVYFPESTVATRLVVLEDGSTVEVGMMGRENVIGAEVLLGATHARYWTVIEVAGQAYRMRSSLFKELAGRFPDLQTAVTRAYQDLFHNVSQRAVCRARHPLLAQLSGWLLMLHDRSPSGTLALTQETIAGRLGVRRAGVTVAANELKRDGALHCTRGHIEIVNRTRLEAHACECYEGQKASRFVN